MNTKRVGLIAGVTALVMLVAFIVGVALADGFDSDDTGSSVSNTIHQIYQREGQSVYFVQSSGPDGVGTGTAWLFDDEGHLVTNEHVISGGTDIAVRVGENRLVPVKLVGEDQSTDLAVLKADPDALNGGDPFELGESSEVFVGQQVVAIGNPFGLEGTVTTGIISAKARVLEAPNGYPISNAIQTDAAINPGNSGGPLVDMDGRVVGVNTQIATGGVGQSAGIGFAVPVDTVKQIADELIEHGFVDRAYLGASTIALTPDLAEQLGLSVDSGALLLEVAPGGPAAVAGLRGSSATAGALVAGGDVIIEIDGEQIAGPNNIAEVVGAKRAGDTSSVTYVRDGTDHTVQVTLGSQPRG